MDDVGLPGPLYLRMAQGADGRLRVREIYIDGSAGESAFGLRDLRDLPLGQIEGLLNGYADEILAHLDEPGPDLSTLASYFRTTFVHDDPGNWVVRSFAAQMKRSQLPADAPAFRKVPRAKNKWKVHDDRDFRLTSGPAEGLTDDFLRDVARAYLAAVARRERPNKAIEEQTGYPLKTVQRWVYTARLRGIMPRGTKGQVG